MSVNSTVASSRSMVRVGTSAVKRCDGVKDRIDVAYEREKVFAWELGACGVGNLIGEVARMLRDAVSVAYTTSVGTLTEPSTGRRSVSKLALARHARSAGETDNRSLRWIHRSKAASSASEGAYRSRDRPSPWFTALQTLLDDLIADRGHPVAAPKTCGGVEQHQRSDPLRMGCSKQYGRGTTDREQPRSDTQPRRGRRPCHRRRIRRVVRPHPRSVQNPGAPFVKPDVATERRQPHQEPQHPRLFPHQLH